MVPTIDRPVQLARCLEAILAGSRRPDAIIVVDQSADDASDRVCAALAGHGAAILRSWSAHRSASAARNQAIARTDSPIIAFTDDDCVPDPGWLVELASTLESDPDLAAATGRVLPLGPDRPDRYAVASRTSGTPAVHADAALPWMAGTGGNLAVRRSWLEHVGGFDERLGPGSAGQAAEDIDLLHRLMRDGGRIAYRPAAVVRHERQTASRRMASRDRYGYGLGAACALWLRDGERRFAITTLARWLASRIRYLIGGTIRGRRCAVAEEARLIRGAAAGFLRGLRLPPRDSAT